jgi:hypothetical protein
MEKEIDSKIVIEIVPQQNFHEAFFYLLFLKLLVGLMDPMGSF